jgi:hypothetical protein
VFRTRAENRDQLERAGYAWDAERDAWMHPETNRELDGHIARTISPEQLRAWLQAGNGRRPF